MKEKITDSKLKRFVSDKLYSAVSTFCRLYDRSYTAQLARRIRHGFLTLYTRVIGVFFFTFGVYSFLIAMLINLFSSHTQDPSSLYGGALISIASVPLLFSKGNVSTILCESAFGNVLCDYLNINRDTLERNTFSGHLSIAFVLGVLFGGITVIFPLSSLIAFIALALMLAVILTSPETGITFITVLLFITGPELQYAVVIATALSYIFKLIRKKRRLCFKKTDAVLLIFAICTLGAVFFTQNRYVSLSSVKYVLLLVPYFLCICLMRDRNKILKVLYTAVMAAGVLCAFYIMGTAVSALIPAGSAVDPDYLLRTVRSLPAFKSTFAYCVFSALIPLCVAFIIKARSDGYRFTFCLCLISIVTCLLLCEELAFLLAAIVMTALFLLITGSRRVYLALGGSLCAFVIASFSGSFGDRLYSYIASHLTEAYRQAIDLSTSAGAALPLRVSVCGQGFDASYRNGASFYYSVLSQLGIEGFVILCVFLVFIGAEAAALIIRTYRSHNLTEAMQRFTGIGAPGETRMCATALVCCVGVCVNCATFCDYYSNETAYLLFFMLCGFCAAFARSSKAEMDAAQGSVLCHRSEDRCSVAL